MAAKIDKRQIDIRQIDEVKRSSEHRNKMF
jgi:hypothetical protein